MQHWPFSNDYQDWVDAIAGRDDFKAYTKEGYIVFNYVSIMAKFDNPDEEGIRETERLYRALRYNMRGAIFDVVTKRLIRLPLHKFHNLNEKLENQFAALNWSEYEVYDKMDGSMIAPFALSTEDYEDVKSYDIIWGSKMGATHLTADVKAFVERIKPSIDYDNFVLTMLDRCYTPIFEYVGNPLHRIVINYDVESLILLGARDMVDGTYVPRSYLERMIQFFNVPIVKRWEVNFEFPACELIERIQDLKDEEGVVIRFSNDHRVKVKASDYVLLHKTRSAVETERFVAACILQDKIDDILPLVPDHVKENLIKYATEFMDLFYNKSQEVVKDVQIGLATYTVRKDFALAEEIDPIAKRIGFAVLDGKVENSYAGIEVAFKNIVLGLCESTETKFNNELREKMFGGELMEWNIWMNTGEL